MPKNMLIVNSGGLAAVAAARHANLQGSGAMAIVRVERGGLARREGSS